MDELEKPDIERLVAEALSGIRKRIALILTACDTVEAAVRNHPLDNMRRICPICGGRMVDMSIPSHAIDELMYFAAGDAFFEESKLLWPVHQWYDHPDSEFPRPIWECTKCGGMTVREPHGVERRWQRGKASPNSFASKIFNHSRQVEEVAYDNNPTDRLTYYRLRVGTEWFRYYGMRDEVLDRIGITT